MNIFIFKDYVLGKIVFLPASVQLSILHIQMCIKKSNLFCLFCYLRAEQILEPSGDLNSTTNNTEVNIHK